MAASDALVPVTSYDSFFGFHEAPFSLAPNTRFRFESASHQAALAQVTYAMQRRDPIIVVTGEIGTGKTLLCRTVVERLDRKTFLSVLSDPMLGRDDLLKRMLQDFGIISTDRAQMTPTSRADLIHALNDFVMSLAPLGAHAVVVLDEAQHAQPDVLEEMRLLSNTHDNRGTMLQVMLVGQDGLLSVLMRPDLKQLKERVARHVRLEPLSGDEVRRYIEHRLRVARRWHTESDAIGARELEQALAEWNNEATSVAFAPAAIDRVARLSLGIPRRINLLCDRSLENAFAAQSHLVDQEMVDRAAEALQLTSDPVAIAPPVATAAAAIVAPAPVVEPVAPATDTAPAGDDVKAPPVARHPSRAPATWAAAAVVVTLVASWFALRSMTPRTVTELSGTAASPATRSQPAPSVAPDTSSAPTATVPARAAAAQAPAGDTTPPGAGPSSERFEIVVASFKTETRANAVAANIAALGQPVRQRVANGWYQVLAGPFPSRARAGQAQEQLERAGFADSQVVPADR